MNKKKGSTVRKTKSRRKPKPLAVLTDEELLEYSRRHTLMVYKQMELMALSNYVNQYQNVLVDKYELPSMFDLSLETGEIHSRDESTNGVKSG